MNRIILFLLLVFLQWASLPAVASAAAEVDELQKLELPLDKPSPEIETATVCLRRTLQDLHLSSPPAQAGAPPLIEMPGQPRVLIGDFAKDGTAYALVELLYPKDDSASSDPRRRLAGVAFARWQTDHWELRGAWTIDPIW